MTAAEETEAVLRDSTDARVWAQEFVAMFHGREIGEGPLTVDEGTMIGWFANAIENGKRAGRDDGFVDGHEAGYAECLMNWSTEP